MKHLFIALSLLCVFLASCGSDDPLDGVIGTKVELTYPLSQAVTGIPRPSDAYQYPYYRGTLLWNSESAAVGYENMINYCIIPEDRLEVMSTAALIQALIDNPERLMLLASNNTNTYPRYKSWVENNRAIAPIFSELLKREDSASELLRMFQSFNPTQAREWWIDLNDIHAIFSYTFCDYAILDRMSSKEKQDLVRSIYDKFHLYNLYQVHYSANEGMLLGRVMLSESYEKMVKLYQKNPEVRDLVDLGEDADGQASQMVERVVNDFVR